MSATPRPWKVIGKDEIIIKGHVCSVGGDQDGNEYFVQGVDYYEGTDGAESDAKLIVLAVNAFPALVSALEAVEWAGDDPDEPRCATCFGIKPGSHKRLHLGHLNDCQLNAALRLARGENQ